MGWLDDAKAAATDQLMASIGAIAEEKFAPLLGEIRAKILEHVTGEPPERFVRAFLAQVDHAGWQLDPEIAQIAWRATIAALASEPAPELVARFESNHAV